MSDMNKEKRAEIIQDALDYLDDDMLESVDKLRNSEKQIQKFPWRRVTAIAASFCLLLIGSYAWENYFTPLNNGQYDEIKGSEPENALGGRDDDFNPAPLETESPSNDAESSTDGEEVRTEIDEDTGQKNPSDSMEESEAGVPGATEPGESLPSEEIDSVEPDQYAPLGDAYLLKGNYTKVTMLPHKAWSADASQNEMLSKSVEIGSGYKGEFDKLVEELCDTPRLWAGNVPEIEKPDTDMVYHLFFHKADGTIVHVWLFDDGYAYYDDDKEYCMQIDRAVYGTVYKLLAMYW